jgi:hypothetical protein
VVDQLKMLMDYTIFHIGMYLTLGALMVSLLGLETFRPRAEVMRPFLVGALACFLVAGAFGALIASNIPYSEKLSEFTALDIGAWFMPRYMFLPASFCMSAEHTLFWLGLGIFLVGFTFARPNQAAAPVTPTVRDTAAPNHDRERPVKTNLERSVEITLLVFSTFSGFALVRFVTTNPSGTRFEDSLQSSGTLWWLAIALSALLLRFMLGSAIHLNQRFGSGAVPGDPDPKVLVFFVKDLLFLVAFGLLSVKMTLTTNLHDFIYWSTAFVSLGFFWNVVDQIVRGAIDRTPNDYDFEKSWLVIDFLQSILLLILLSVALDDGRKAFWFAAVCFVFFIWDAAVLVGKRMLPLMPIRTWILVVLTTAVLVVAEYYCLR